MGKRTVTGLLIFLVTAIAVASKLLNGLFFDAFVMAISFVACYELLKVYNSEERKCSKMYIYLSAIHIGLLYVSYFISKTLLQALTNQLLLFVIFFVVSFVCEIVYLAKNRTEEIENTDLLLSTKRLMSVMIYPNTLLGTLYGVNRIAGTNSIVILILIFGIAMMTDVFAYLVGSLWHKGNFAPQISPKKSVSGAVGGLLGGIIFSMLVWLLFIELNLFDLFTLKLSKSVTIYFFAFAGVLGSLVTEFGDLVASTIKRIHNIKDYGNLFPGHGGMLDRVDGQMFCSATIYVLAIIMIL